MKPSTKLLLAVTPLALIGLAALAVMKAAHRASERVPSSIEQAAPPPVESRPATSIATQIAATPPPRPTPPPAAQAPPILDPNATAGRVVTTAGEGIAGVRLIGYPLMAQAEPVPSGEEPFQGMSGGGGSFQFLPRESATTRKIQITTAPGSDWNAIMPVIADAGAHDVVIKVAPSYAGGVVRGSAVNGRSRSPLPGQKVLLRKITGPEATLAAEADPQGRFEFTGVKAGVYQFRSEPDDHGLSLRGVADPAVPANATGSSTVTITEQSPRAERTLLFGRPLRVSGRLLDDATGEGLEGAGIGLSAADHPVKNALKPESATRTGAGGTFIIDDAAAAVIGSARGPLLGVAATDANLSISQAEGGGPGGELDPRDGVYRFLLPDPMAERLENITLRAGRTASLRGNVRLASGAPYPGAEIFLCEEPATIQQSPALAHIIARSGPDGRFEIPAPMLKKMVAGARSSDGGLFFSQPFTLAPAGTEVTITIGEADRVTGRVVDPSGNPIYEAEVQLADAGGKVIGSARSDLDGTFELTVPAGVQCKARASKEGYFPSDWLPPPSSADPIAFILALSEKAPLRARVINTDKNPVEGASVTIFGPGAEDVARPTAKTDKDGRAEFPELRAGRAYTLSVSKDEIETIAKDLMTGDDEHEIMLDHFFLLKCVITATDAQGKPVTGYTATAHMSDPAILKRSPQGAGPWTCDSADGRLEVLMAPGADLHFDLAHDQLGKTTTEVAKWETVSQMLDPNEPVTEIGFPAAFGVWAAVEGRLVSISKPDLPIPGIELRLEPVEGAEALPPAKVVTGDDGTFKFERTRAGAYTLAADPTNRPPLRLRIFFRAEYEASRGNIPYFALGGLEVATKAGDGLPDGVRVRLTSRIEHIIRPSEITFQPGASAIWENLAEGDYFIAAPEYGVNAHVLVPAQETLRYELDLGDESLTIHFAFRGNPIEGLKVMLRQTAPVLDGLNEARYGDTDLSGNCLIKGLRRGNHQLQANWPPGFFSKYGCDARYALLFLPLSIAVPSSDAPVVSINLPAGMIAGTVDSRLKGRSGTTTLGLEWLTPGEAYSSFTAAGGRTNSLGQFAFPGLPAGRYRLSTTGDGPVASRLIDLGENEEKLDVEINPTGSSIP